MKIELVERCDFGGRILVLWNEADDVETMFDETIGESMNPLIEVSYTEIVGSSMQLLEWVTLGR